MLSPTLRDASLRDAPQGEVSTYCKQSRSNPSRLAARHTMIFEMRTYLMKPGSIPRVEELFGAGLPARARLSRFGGFWRTEVGTLNQIIHVWPYKDLAEREHIRAEAIRTGIWPVKIQDVILEMESKILHA